MKDSDCDVLVHEQLDNEVVKRCVRAKSIDVHSQEIKSYVTIFDYDDTIFPSSWLTQVLGCRSSLSNEMIDQLKRVDATASILLREAIKNSVVIIVTNAEKGWVEHSSNVFLPSVYQLLRYVHICSARSRYESSYPLEASKWKQLTFIDEVDIIRNQIGGRVSLLSIGDSLHEREAVFSYGANNSNVIAKSIKMIDTPTPSQLSTQQELIYKALNNLTVSSDKLDLKLSVQSSA